MTSDKSKLTNIKDTNGGEVTLGDNKKGKVIEIGSVGNEHITISDV